MEGACAEIVPEASSSENEIRKEIQHGLKRTRVVKKPRGRPRKIDSVDGAPKRSKGRPKKVESSDGRTTQKFANIEILAESLRKAGEDLSSYFSEEELQFSLPDGPSTSGGGTIPKAKRPRGRPRKYPAVQRTGPPLVEGKRCRGRPRKTMGNYGIEKGLEEAIEELEQPKTLKTSCEETGGDEEVCYLYTW